MNSNIYAPAKQQTDALIAAERELLGAIILDSQILKSSEVSAIQPSDFIDPANQCLFGGIRRMVAENRPIDLLTVVSFLRTEGLEDSAGGPGYVPVIMNRVCTAGNFAYHAGIVAGAAKSRRTMMLASAMALRLEAGDKPDDVLQFARDGIRGLTTEAANDVELLSAAALDSGDFALDYHVENVLAIGQPSIMAAAQKAMKTSLAIELGISLAMGVPFLGTFRTRQAEVLILSGESGTATIQETARRICRSKGVELGDLTGFHFSPWIPRLNDPQSLATLSRILEKTKAKIVFLDPAYLMMAGDDANNLFKQGAELRRLSEVCSEAGTTPVLIHHNRKSTGAEANALPELAHIAWSGFAEFARQWILLSRREPYEPGSGDHRLWMVTGGSAGHGGAWGLDIFEGTRETVGGRVWQTHLAPAGQIRQETQEAELNAKAAKQDDRKRRTEDFYDAKILKCLNGEWKTSSAIRTATEMNSTNTAASLKRLLETGDIIEGETQISNRTYTAYKRGDGQRWTALDKSTLSDGGSVGQTKAPKGGFVLCPSVQQRLSGDERNLNLSNGPAEVF